jgi:hypothetical protein
MKIDVFCNLLPPRYLEERNTRAGSRFGQAEDLRRKCTAPLTAAYLIPITIESGPTSGSTRVEENPTSLIHPSQSAPVWRAPEGQAGLENALSPSAIRR